MGATFDTENGSVSIPGWYASYRAALSAAGLPTTGVVLLVGEAEAGPDYTLEGVDLEENSFGSDQLDEIEAKYVSGPVVDAARAAINANGDARILGAVGRVVIAKTNVSTAATLQLEKWDASDYGVLAATQEGQAGNLLSVAVTARTSEVIPTTSEFTYIPAVGTVAYNLRVNGGTAVGGTLGANTAPSLFVSTLAALAGVEATGGANLGITPAAGNIALTHTSGNNVQIDLSSTVFAVVPEVGDTLVIPDGSVIQGAADANVGAYVITGATTIQILATKLSDAGATAFSPVPGTITVPATVGSGALSGSPANDIKAFGAVTVTQNAGDPIDGIGKSLEIAQLTTGTDLLERTAFQLGTTTAVTWVSKTGASKLLTSASEYVAKLHLARAATPTVDTDIIAGGDIALKLGYLGTTAALAIDDGSLTITVVGGSGQNLSLDLTKFSTITDLASNINSQVGYSAAVGTTLLGQLPPSALDDVSTTAASTFGAQVCRLKMDAKKLFDRISSSGVIELQDADGNVVQAAAGLPEPQSTTFFSGGAKGSTTAAAVVAALEALEHVPGNFVVTCFSRDASDDIEDGLTESGSTYEIDSVNAALKSHVLLCSTFERQDNRQGFSSKQGTFSQVQEDAANTASFRMAFCFEDVKLLGSDGLLHQQQPYCLAALAAGQQAAGFYRDLTGKLLNCSGVLQAAGDFNDRNKTNVKDALGAGLLTARRADTGGFEWVSDQTCYGRDNSDLYNSISAVYRMDTLSLGMKQRMEKAFKGENISDAPASLILRTFDTNMGDFMRLKLIAPSDGAPKGYTADSLVLKVVGKAVRIKAQVFDNVSLKFGTIDFTVGQTTQSAQG